MDQQEPNDIILDAEDYKPSGIDQEEALEKILQAQDITIKLVWIAATMSVIAAINSLTGATVLIKSLAFMLVALASLIIYGGRFKK